MKIPPVAARTICGLLLAGWVAGCSPGGSQKGYFKTPYQDESQFIVEEVLADIAEMGWYAANKNLPEPKRLWARVKEKANSPDSAPIYDVEIKLDKKSVKLELQINGPIWSPANYADAAAKIVSALRVPQAELPQDTAQDKALLKALLNVKPDNLAAQDRGIAEELGKDFGNPELHEKAALLLGVFALRDAAGLYFDSRLPLCRMTAHLAFSQALSGESRWGVNGRLANAMRLTVVNNEREALAEIDSWKEPELEAWDRVLSARNRHDYRELHNQKVRTLAERVEMFRAYVAAQDADMAMEHITAAELTEVPDYWRAAAMVRNSVGVNNALLERAIPMEMKELSQVYLSYHGKALEEGNFVTALNEKPGRCVTRSADGKVKVEVIGWGQWSFFCQRHLLQAMVRSVDILRNSLGLPADATRLAAEYDKEFGGLYLYPFALRKMCSDDAGYRRSMDGMVAVTRATPQLVSPGAWDEIYQEPQFTTLYVVPGGHPHVNEWHRHSPPPGTVYDLGGRLGQATVVGRGDVQAMFEQFLKMAPYDLVVVQNAAVARFQAASPTYEQAEPFYRAGLDFNVRFMRAVVSTLTNRPAEYEKMMVKMAEHLPCTYLTLGTYFMDRGDITNGVKYLEKSLAECGNSVGNANQAGRLVRYYWNQGEKQKAYDLADFAADRVYSYSGLAAKAELLELDGRYEEALVYYQKLEERYGDKEAVGSFVVRYKAKTGGNKLDDLLKARVARLFPKGLESAKLGDFSGEPKDGVLIAGENAEVTKAGLRQGMVIVALYGTRVHNLEQYSHLRDVATESQLDLIVCRGGKYEEVKASPPNHRFGVNFVTYPPR